MEKKIVMSMPDGSEWAVKVSDVAEHRDQYRKDSAEYFSDYPEEAIDWFQNNTNWGEIPLERIKEPNEPDYSEFYNFDMVVKEI